LPSFPDFFVLTDFDVILLVRTFEDRRDGDGGKKREKEKQRERERE
jgi:hypothetical protein